MTMFADKCIMIVVTHPYDKLPGDWQTTYDFCHIKLYLYK